MIHPTILARKIVRILENTKVNVSTEASAHLSVANSLRAGLELFSVQDEVRLSEKDRIDILVGGVVGVEIKVKSDRRSVFNQLERYAAHEQIEALVLVTGAAWPPSMKEIGGKPFFLASLSKGWL